MNIVTLVTMRLGIFLYHLCIGRQTNQTTLQPLTKEMNTNFNSSNEFQLQPLKDATSKYNEAFIEGSCVLRITMQDHYKTAAMSNKWSVDGKRKYLLEHYKDGVVLIQSKETIEKARLRKRMKDPDDSLTLADMLVDCWSRNGVEEKDLVDILIDYKGGE